jgi:short-subunit dehydrogenase
MTTGQLNYNDPSSQNKGENQMRTPYRLALVTGASSGLGEEFAIQLAKQGSDVILVARSQNKLLQLAESLKSQYQIQAHVLTADLSKTDEVEKVHAQSQKIGAVDLLVNNAGFGSWGYCHDLDPKTEMQMIDLNCKALYLLSRLFLNDFRRQKQGAILNVASIAGILPGPLYAAYAATKSFVIQFSEALAFENEIPNIRISVLCPGATRTNFAAVALGGKDKSSGRQVIERMAATPQSVVAEGLAGLKRGKRVVIAGGSNRIMVRVAKIFPKAWLAKIIENLFRRVTQ